MSVHDPIAYTYEADYHCPRCTEARFGRDETGTIAPQETSIDSEGNPVGAVFSWDEWWEPTEPGHQTLTCTDCFDVLDEVNEL